MKKKIFALLMAAALCLTGCSAKVTEKDADKDVLELLEDCDYDIEELSEAARTILFQMDMDEFLSMYNVEDDDEFEGYVDLHLEWYGSYGVDSKKDMEKILEAELEDMLIIHSIYSSYCNAYALGEVINAYATTCEEQDVDVDKREFSGKIKSKVPSGKVKFNGKNGDLELFIQKCMNDNARNGYYYIELDRSGMVDEAYWSDDKAAISDDSNHNDEYEYDLNDIAEGEPIVIGYDASWSITGTNVYKIAKKSDEYSNVAEEDFICDYWYYTIEDDVFPYKKAREEINELISECMEDDLGKKYVSANRMNEANANAKIVHTACATLLTKIAIDNFTFKSDAEYETMEFGPYIDEAVEVTWSTLKKPEGYNFELRRYLGSEYDGYAYVVFDPRTYAVHYALWSEKPIPDEYKTFENNFDSEKLKDIAEDGQIIGCYPILSK